MEMELIDYLASFYDNIHLIFIIVDLDNNSVVRSRSTYILLATLIVHYTQLK
jgi:hypothetical protein